MILSLMMIFDLRHHKNRKQNVPKKNENES